MLLAMLCTGWNKILSSFFSPSSRCQFQWHSVSQWSMIIRSPHPSLHVVALILSSNQCKTLLCAAWIINQNNIHSVAVFCSCFCREQWQRFRRILVSSSSCNFFVQWQCCLCVVQYKCIHTLAVCIDWHTKIDVSIKSTFDMWASPCAKWDIGFMKRDDPGLFLLKEVCGLSSFVPGAIFLHSSTN